MDDVFDPYVTKESNVESLDELLQKSEYLMLVTDHDEFKEMNLQKLKILK